MQHWRITYFFYLATGMEGKPDVRDYGIVEANSAFEACVKSAKQHNPNHPDLEEWDRGCLRATKIN